MKMNTIAPAPNMAPVTKPGNQIEGRRFVPWFWPDSELSQSVKLRQAAFLEDQERVLKTADGDPVTRAAAQQLLWLQSNYLATHFPDKYTIETNNEYGGKVIINKTTDDHFALRPESGDWHPLAISGMLSQEDICIVRRIKTGQQILVAGFLATPTHWNLSNFLNADMDKIHKHVKGYHKPVDKDGTWRLKDTVDKTLQSLREYPDGIITRNNQFIEYNPSLALEPTDRTPFKMNKVRNDLGNRLFLRSERETLTRLPAPYDDFSVFTIKPNVFRMSDVRKHRSDDFVRALASNAILKSVLKSNKRATGKDAFDFTDSLQTYLNDLDHIAE
jgi:hypothetical protein